MVVLLSLGPNKRRMKDNIPEHLRQYWEQLPYIAVAMRFQRQISCCRSKASYTWARQMVREPNARMCGRDCEPALRHLRTVRIPFSANRNLSVFCTNTKRTRCAGCPFYELGVLCSPQVHGKLINRVPNMCRMRMAQHVSGALMYTRF